LPQIAKRLLVAFQKIIMNADATTTSTMAQKRMPTDSGLYTQISSEYFKKSNTFGIFHSVPDLILLVSLLVGIAFLPWQWKLLCAFIIGIVGYRLTFVIHDCSNSTLFRTKALNTFFGWLASAILFTSFPTFRRLHASHHRYYREDLDPQGEDYNGLLPGRDNVVLHLFKPLFFLNTIQKLSNVIAVSHCGMTPAEKTATTAEIAKAAGEASTRPYVCILIAQIFIALIATGGGAFLWGYLLYIVPLVSIGLFVSRIRSYMEHGDLKPSDGKYRIARTHYSNIIERNIFAGIFFNFHHEHHLWPGVPSRHLTSVYENFTKGKHPDQDFQPSYMSSLKILLAASRS
jgi:fatty acid desaturase